MITNLVDDETRYVRQVRITLQLSEHHASRAVCEASVRACFTLEADLVTTQRPLTARGAAVAQLLTDTASRRSILKASKIPHPFQVCMYRFAKLMAEIRRGCVQTTEPGNSFKSNS